MAAQGKATGGEVIAMQVDLDAGNTEYYASQKQQKQVTAIVACEGNQRIGMVPKEVSFDPHNYEYYKDCIQNFGGRMPQQVEYDKDNVEYRLFGVRAPKIMFLKPVKLDTHLKVLNPDK
ncbi:uncharacterized protein [Watersipora subatra]|uniref:uncharacterized protein n=1 Tax=Watersipora subatra TaxID=2589382 RepID=UPI00355C1DEA